MKTHFKHYFLLCLILLGILCIAIIICLGQSNHSYGLAIDINPLYNPYITYHNGVEKISPSNAFSYADRSLDFEHKIDEEDLCYKIFIEQGFTWGGAWKNSKDYQHFEYKIEEK